MLTRPSLVRELPHGAAVVAAHTALALPLLTNVLHSVHEGTSGAQNDAVLLGVTMICSVVLVVVLPWCSRWWHDVLGCIGLCGVLGIAHAVVSLVLLKTLAGQGTANVFWSAAFGVVLGACFALPAGFVLGAFTSLPVAVAAWARHGTHRYASGSSLLVSGAFAVGLALLARWVPVSHHDAGRALVVCHAAIVVGAAVVVRGMWLLVRAARRANSPDRPMRSAA